MLGVFTHVCCKEGIETSSKLVQTPMRSKSRERSTVNSQGHRACLLFSVIQGDGPSCESCLSVVAKIPFPLGLFAGGQLPLKPLDLIPDPFKA